MGQTGKLLITGATGFLGRYLLRDWLAAGGSTVILVRDKHNAGSAERLAELLAFCETSVERAPKPIVLRGDLDRPGLGLSAVDRDWLGRRVTSVLHSAACLALARSPKFDPWKTNVDGTQNLLDLCRDLGIADFHHVSTAYVCGARTGLIREQELDRGQAFHNRYEKSKLEAERRVGLAQGLCCTIYRPSVIVGDSRTGETKSYHGFYRLLELADRLAGPPVGPRGRRYLPLGLPFTGQEPHNLVPVDWVAQAIVRIASRPQWHGRTYHLVARKPVLARQIRDCVSELLHIDGVEWSGFCKQAGADDLAALFQDYLRDYWPYLGGDPIFDYRNASDALSDLPPPHVDQPMLARLIQFAIRDGWGRFRKCSSKKHAKVNCPWYVETFFPDAVRRAALAQLRLTLQVNLEVQGTAGGRWTCSWDDGDFKVGRGFCPNADVTYRLDVATFSAVVHGRLSPRQAFFDQRIAIAGDLEKGLKLAVLFEQFVQENSLISREVEHVCHATG